MTRGRDRVASRALRGFGAERRGTHDFVLLLVFAVILILGILLAPLGAGIITVATLILIGIVGIAVWGLFLVRSRRGSRESSNEAANWTPPEILGPGGPDDPRPRRASGP